MSELTRRKCVLAALSRHRDPDDPELINARCDLRAEKLEAFVAKTLNAWPPLTREQLDRVGALLAAGRVDAQE